MDKWTRTSNARRVGARRFRPVVAVCLSMLLLLGAAAPHAEAANKIWTGMTDQFFFTWTNWSLWGVPGASDNAVFSNAALVDSVWFDGNPTNDQLLFQGGDIGFYSYAVGRTYRLNSASVTGGDLLVYALDMEKSSP